MNSQELNSWMLYVHPPLAIAGYALIFLFTIFLFRAKNSGKRIQLVCIAAWVLTFMGLVTGMIWAQMAWGSYWSWDPKENLTLLLFTAVSAGTLSYFEEHPKAAKWLFLTSCILTVVTASSSFIIAGLHSFMG
jgi:cytochrome c biogenesis factor